MQEFPGALVGIEARFSDQIPQFRRPAVDEFGSQLDDDITISNSPDASTDTIARLQNTDSQTGFGEVPRGRQPRHSCSDDDDVPLDWLQCCSFYLL
jgi:hypothetical protein